MEKQLNGHTYQLCRILGVGIAWDDGSRVKPAMTKSQCNGQAPHLISLILNETAKLDEGSECNSNEEMIAAMEEVNKK